jgi:hypothetical protein
MCIINTNISKGIAMSPGRPIKYTPERLHAILCDISDRIPYQLAAESNGIREATLYAWINQGLDEADQGLDTPLASFSESLKRIEKERIKHHLIKLDENGNRWQADAWILERRWHKHFGANVLQKEQEERLNKLEEKFLNKE